MTIRRFVSYSELKFLGINYCRVHLRRMMRAGLFPHCVAIGPGRIGWYEDEIAEWAHTRPKPEYRTDDE